MSTILVKFLLHGRREGNFAEYLIKPESLKIVTGEERSGRTSLNEKLENSGKCSSLAVLNRATSTPRAENRATLEKREMPHFTKSPSLHLWSLG